MSEPDPDRLETALILAEAGYHQAPVRLGRNPATGRKMPVYGGLWSQISTVDQDQIVTWMTEGVRRRHDPITPEDLSLLIDCSASDILVVDLDVKPHQDPERALDGVTRWAQEGAPISPMRVETPSGGEHHYWKMPDPPLINSEGLIAPGIDTRGVGGHVFAPGAFILGDDGPGYVLLDRVMPAAELPVLPEDIGILLRTAPAEHRVPTGQRADGRQHDERWIRNTMANQLERVRAHDPQTGGFRAILRGASLVCGRAVTAALIDRSEAEKLLGDAVFGVWASVDADDMTWISTGLDDGICDPWTVTPERMRTLDKSVASILGRAAQGTDAPEAEDLSAWDARVLAEVEIQDMREEARQIRAVRDRPPLVRLSASEFLERPRPTFLIPEMIYRDSLSVVFGPEGSAKSFFVLDLALHMATGLEWRGLDLGRHRIHYVMAEGDAVNANRTEAWLLHHGIERTELDGWFDVFPEGLLLTDAGVQAYLFEVTADEPAWIILDTKNAMMEGNESLPADVAIMRRALESIRRVCGSAVTLIDHTGLRDETRARGSNAQRAALGSEVRLTDGPNGSRVAEISRDKSGDVDGAGPRWAFRLAPVEHAPRVYHDRPEVVPVPVALGEEESGDFYGDKDWTWLTVPADVAEYHESKGKGSELIMNVCKVMMHYGAGASGMTQVDVVRHLASSYPDVTYNTHRMRVRRAWDALWGLGRLESVATSGTSRTAAHRWIADEDMDTGSDQQE